MQIAIRPVRRRAGAAAPTAMRPSGARSRLASRAAPSSTGLAGRAAGDRHRAPRSRCGSRRRPGRRRPRHPQAAARVRRAVDAVEPATSAPRRSTCRRQKTAVAVPAAARRAAGSRGSRPAQRSRGGNLSFAHTMTAEPLRRAADLADARAYLAAAREPRAARPGPARRRCAAPTSTCSSSRLCDLAGASTMSVGADADGTRDVARAARRRPRLRAAGMDWPLQGLTMVGLGRLDDLQALRRGGRRRRRRGRPDRGRLVARRRVDAHARHARHARRRRAPSGSPTRSRASRSSTTRRARRRLGAFDFLAVPVEEVRDELRPARAGARRRVRARASSRRRCRARRPALGDRPARRRQLRGDAAGARSPLPRPGGRRLPGRRRLRLVRGLPPGGRRVPRASTASTSRSSRSTTPARAGARDRATPIAVAPGARRAPPRRARDRGDRPRDRARPDRAASSSSRARGRRSCRSGCAPPRRGSGCGRGCARRLGR